MPTLLVLAGGFGTRLSSMVKGVPKPLAPVCGTPFLEHQIINWRKQNISSFIFLLHYESKQIIDALEQWRETILKGSRVRYLVESSPLGTAGAVCNAVKQLDLHGEILITNADTWLSGGIDALDRAGADSILAVRVADSRRYGSLEIDHRGFVRSFSEKSEGYSGVQLISAGTYVLLAEHFRVWKSQVGSLESDFFPTLVKKSALRAVPVDIEFTDIGVPEDYQRFCSDFSRNKVT